MRFSSKRISEVRPFFVEKTDDKPIEIKSKKTAKSKEIKETKETEKIDEKMEENWRITTTRCI